MKERSRGWQFTLNNYTPEEEKELRALDSEYLQYGYEVAPTTGTPHLQGYIKFKNMKSFTQMKKMVPRARFSAVRFEEYLINYNEKDGNVYEQGQRPKTQKQKGQTTQERYKAAIEAAQAGRLSDVEPDMYLRYYRTLRTIEKDFMKKPASLDHTCGEWVFGSSGCGKTRYVHTTYGHDLYLKPTKTKWWDGYQGEKYVLIDDFDHECKHQSHHLKIWADHYPFQAEIKGGAVMIRPEKIIITSQYTIEELFRTDSELVDALRRRFRINCLDGSLYTGSGSN